MTKNYNDISWKHLLHGVNLYSKKYSKDFGKEAAFGLEQCCHSLTRMNITDNGFWKHLESPIQKDAETLIDEWTWAGDHSLEVQAVKSLYLHHNVDERFHLNKESYQQKRLDTAT